MTEDVGLDRLQFRTRLQTQLACQVAARTLIRVQSLGLASSRIQRAHQLCRDMLRVGCSANSASSSGTSSRVATEVEVGVDPGLERHQVEFLKAADVRLGEILERDLRQRWPAPQP